MRPQDHILVLCARQRFTAADRANVREWLTRLELSRTADESNQLAEWNHLYDTATDHRLAPLVFENLATCVELPHEIAARVERDRISNVVIKAERRRELFRLLDLFEELRVPVLLIKGEALDWTVYEQPWYTASADIDLVLMGKKTDVPSDGLDRIAASLPEVPFIETNWRTHHDITLNGILPVDFDRVWGDAEPVMIEGRSIPAPIAEDALLFAAINSCRKKFFRLKSLCDLSEIVRARPDLDWDRVARRAAEWRCRGIVYTALYVCERLMRCGVPARVFTDLKIGPVRGRIVRFLADRLSFSNLDAMRDGMKNGPRRYKGPAALLPYASYSMAQVVRNAVRR